jgi:hypothetical protein
VKRATKGNEFTIVNDASVKKQPTVFPGSARRRMQVTNIGQNSEWANWQLKDDISRLRTEDWSRDRGG